ncbi:hypothetical protein [Nonomuraea sp. LPB2021202275-12-8]|uniref:hypothetical protein n=1 Tax=Nonomuraea sp. LPB2021202275-12-8 TaxID=3120159 RepID=UPI00300C7EE4
MLIEQARQVARRWAREEGARLPGFAGAFLTGSALWARPGSALPPSSDVDVMLVLDDLRVVPPGKFRYGGVLLEVSLLSWEALGPPADPAGTVLGHYHLAGAFHRDGVLADPSGRLTAIQRAVSHRFAERHWVLARCAHAAETVRDRIAGMDEPASLPDQVTAWLFGTGVTAHVLLVAGLRNPTVRRRYEAVGELLAERGLPGHHEHLLDLLGCADLGPARVRHHLRELERVFDVAKDVPAPSYRFASDISGPAKPVAIGGGHELVDRGLHREAVFWLVATYARCLAKLASAGMAASDDGLRSVLADLGAETSADRRRRGDRVLAALPGLLHTAESLAPVSDRRDGRTGRRARPRRPRR